MHTGLAYHTRQATVTIDIMNYVHIYIYIYR